jgi:hypothetical protein
VAAVGREVLVATGGQGYYSYRYMVSSLKRACCCRMMFLQRCPR